MNWVSWGANIRRYFNIYLQLWKFIQRQYRRIEARQWLLYFEVMLVILWAVFLGRAYLVDSPKYYVGGGEVEMSTQSHTVWDNLLRCGTCVFWNGAINGGNPSFVETHGAPLHPLVIFSSLLYDETNSTKLVMLGSLILAGLAQWWLAWVLKLSRPTRLWTSAIVVAGGHLAGKMSVGSIPLVISIASVSLVLAPLVDLIWNQNRRAVIWLACMLALAWVSGQGYVQIVLLMTWIPAAVILFATRKVEGKPVIVRLFQSLAISVLLAGLFLAPFLHFLPNFGKAADVLLESFQRLEYIPLNLVIRDHEFLASSSLSKSGMAYLNTNYIGWIPVAFAVVGLMSMKSEQRRLMAFFGLSMGLVFLVCSADFAIVMTTIIPIFNRLRNLPVAQALAVPPLMGMAGIGFDAFLRVVNERFLSDRRKKVNLGKSVVLIVPLALAFMSIFSVYEFSEPHYYVQWLEPDKQEVELLEASSAQWVVELGNNSIPPLLDKGVKLLTFRPWYWRGKENLEPYLILVFNPDQNRIENSIYQSGYLDLLKNPDWEYAFIQAGDQKYACSASSAGGNIDVECNAPVNGTLVVRENSWTGWYVRVDAGEMIPVEEGTSWLQTKALRGAHTYSFRYRPWDVWVGLAGVLVGILVCVMFLRQRPGKKWDWRDCFQKHNEKGKSDRLDAPGGDAVAQDH